MAGVLSLPKLMLVLGGDDNREVARFILANSGTESAVFLADPSIYHGAVINERSKNASRQRTVVRLHMNGTNYAGGTSVTGNERTRLDGDHLANGRSARTSRWRHAAG